MKKISVVIPVYNEEENISKISTEVLTSMPEGYISEVLFINDGSSDNTLAVLKELSNSNERVKYISFSRNFGHQYALKAGLDHSTGDAVISMDGDLQHPPSLIPKLIERWESGVDIVGTTRIDHRNTGLFKKISSKLFYSFFRYISKLDLPKGAADFRLLDRKVVNVLKKFNESHLFIRGIIHWVGFKQEYISYTANERNAGKSKYSFLKMVRFSLAGLTSFSVRPLHLASIVGGIFSLLGFSYAVYALLVHFIFKETVVGWTSIVASILFMGGLQLIVMGVFGEYLGKMFIESKSRPNYIIDEKKLE